MNNSFSLEAIMNALMPGNHRGIPPMIRRMSLSLVAVFLLLGGQMAEAAQVAGVSLEAGKGGQTVRIHLDQAGNYQVYDLEAPKRVAISLPGYSLAKGVEPIQGSGAVRNVFPVSSDGAARIEIGLDQAANYSIAESGTDLLVKVAGGKAVKAEANGAVIKDIVARDQGDMTEVVLRGEHMDANHNAFLTNQGRTLIVDYWNSKSKLPKDYYPYATQKVSGVSIGAAEDRVRLVFNLVPGGKTDHQLVASANELKIRVGNVRSEKASGSMVVEAVDFQPDDRIAHISIRTSSANPVVNMVQREGKLVLDVANASLLPEQERSQDVSAFPGPVRQVDSYRLGRDVRIVARLRQKVEVSSFQSGNVLTVNLVPEDVAREGRAVAAAEEGKLAYTGQKVSFDFKDIDIRNALKLIAEMSDLNIIMSDDVSGTLTMRLVDVPWDQALDLILVARGLGKEKQGNVLRIAPLAVLKADAKAREEATVSAEAIAPLETEFIELGYASVNDVKTILQGGSVKAAAGAQGEGQKQKAASTSSEGGLKLLSDRGSILLDERSNTMIITDTRERLDNIKRLIARIDKPVQQVLIESRIVEASDSFSRDLGVRWGGTYNDTTTKYTHNVTGASTAPFAVDLPAAVGPGSGGAIGYTLGALSGAFNLNLELSAAEAEGKAKIVSSPRVFTSNLQPAKIEQDTQVPFAQTTFAGGVATQSVTQVSSKLTLEVTPQITADKAIIMDLKVNKDTPLQNNLGGTEPIINKKTVETKLLVDNGETVVLGGIYTQDLSNDVSGVPLLKDIPLIGYLFKKKTVKDNRNELLIFITPTIIERRAKGAKRI